MGELTTAVSLAALLVSGAVGVLAWRGRRLSRALRASSAELRAALRRYHWIEWWTRNAAETTPLDPDKAWLVRLAYVAALMPSLDAFRVELERIVTDPRHPPQLHRAAFSFLSELQAVRAGAEAPWDVWDRETGGRPRQAVEALAREVQAAIYGSELHPLELPEGSGEPPG